MRKSWSKEIVINEIKKRAADGKALNFQAVVIDDEKLTGAARRYFNSWDNAMIAAGYKLEDYKNPQDGEKLSWDKNSIMLEARKLKASGADMSAHAVQKTYSKLVTAATFYYGSWKNLIEEMGIDYSVVRKTAEWDKQSVVEAIKKAKSQGADLSDSNVYALNASLYGAAATHFSSWSAAVEAAGFDPESVRRTRIWTPERVIETFVEAYNCGVTLRQLNSLGILYDRTILDHFASIEDMIAASGVDPQSDISFKKDDARLISSNMREVREGLGISVSELAEKIGYSGRWIGLIELGQAAPSLPVALRIASLLNSTVDNLFSLKKSPPTN